MIFLRIPFRTHALDQRLRHFLLALSDLGLFRDVQLLRIGQLFGEMHQLEHERVLQSLYPGEILPRLDHHLRDTDFFAVLESIAQKRVGFIPALLRFQIVRFIKKHGVDLVLVDEVLNINRLRRFEVYALKIFIPEHNIFSFFI